MGAENAWVWLLIRRWMKERIYNTKSCNYPPPPTCSFSIRPCSSFSPQQYHVLSSSLTYLSSSKWGTSLVRGTDRNPPLIASAWPHARPGRCMNQTNKQTIPLHASAPRSPMTWLCLYLISLSSFLSSCPHPLVYVLSSMFSRPGYPYPCQSQLSPESGMLAAKGY